MALPKLLRNGGHCFLNILRYNWSGNELHRSRLSVCGRLHIAFELFSLHRALPVLRKASSNTCRRNGRLVRRSNFNHSCVKEILLQLSQSIRVRRSRKGISSEGRIDLECEWAFCHFHVNTGWICQINLLPESVTFYYRIRSHGNDKSF